MIPVTGKNINMAAFVARVEPLGPMGQRDAMRAEIMAQDGSYDLPPDTTDGYHIALFGLQAIGINEQDAIRHWLCNARTLLGGFPEVSQDPDMRLPQITWATHIMACANCTRIATHHLRAACKIILDLSSNAILRDRAYDLARAQNFFPMNLGTGTAAE